MSRKVTNGLDLLNRPIDNVADPATGQQAATKSYVDAFVRGLDWKQECIAASTGNVNISSPGTSIDGVTLSNPDRVLLKDQTTPSQNGIYIFTGPSSAMQRSFDANDGPKLSGSTTTVQRGTVNADRVYRVNTDDTITLETTPITWVQVGGAAASYTAGNGLSLSGGQFAVVPGAGILADGTSTRVDPSVVVRKFSSTIGNGALTQIPVVHNLSTLDVQVTVYDSSTKEEVITDVIHTDVNTVTIGFATAPAAGAYRAVVFG